MSEEAREALKAEESKPHAAAPARLRPWYRLHASTYVIGLAVLVLLVLVIVPGQVIFGAAPGRTGIFPFATYEHGWPMAHLRRFWVLRYPGQNYQEAQKFANDVLGEPRPWYWLEPATGSTSGSYAPAARPVFGKPAWLTSGAWGHTGVSARWYPLGLLVNLLTATMILSIVSAGWEWRRRHRNRWFQFQVRELLTATFFVALGLGWWQWNVREWNREQQAAVAAANADFDVLEDSHAPVWLHRLAGRNSVAFCDRVTGTSGPRLRGMEGPPDYDAVAAAHRARQIRPLLKEFAGLQYAGFREADADTLAALAELKQLRRLYLDTPDLCDDHLAAIGRVSQIEELEVSARRNPRSDAITDAGLIHLGRLTNLRSLNVANVRVGGPGLRALRPLDGLTELAIRDATITDEALAELCGLKQLRRLTLSFTDASPSAVARLRAALPNTEVLVHPDP